MHVMLARAELTANRPEQAIAELRKALAADPRNVDAHYYLWLATKTQAQEEYQKLFAMAPDYYRVHQLMGEAALAADRPTEAENEFLAALDAKPNSLEVLAELGNLKRSQSKYDEAIGYYTKAEQAGPLNYDIAYGLGVCYTFTQEYDRAIHYLSESIRIDPVSPDARLALGSAWVQNGKFEAAVPELERAVQLDPHMNQAYFLLARAYQKLGRKEDAAAAFKKPFFPRGAGVTPHTSNAAPIHSMTNGFTDAFNPLTNWYNPDVLGIDLGITMLMAAENQRTGFVWKTFMKNKEAQRGMEKAGFQAQHA